MPTLASKDFESDSGDDDSDFIPASPKRRSRRVRRPIDGNDHDESSSSGSETDSDLGDEGEADEAKQSRVEQEAAQAEKRRSKAAEVFEAMQVESAGRSSPKSVAGKKTVEMVEIRRPRQFAGETIYETVTLAADDPEAVAYLEKQAKGAVPAEPSLGEAAAKIPPSADAGSSIAIEAPNAGSTATAPPTTAHAAGPAPADRPKPPLRKGPPKRKASSLEAMSAALDKGKKMTTLEKSQMDWKSHTASNQSMSDELAKNRKGGGYLDKQQFLDRVGERRTGTFDGQASGRR